MNIYFCDLGLNLSNNIIGPTYANIKLLQTNPKIIFINPIHQLEVYKIVSEMKDKTGGVDGINSKTLKTISTYISLPLEYTFNYRSISIISNIAKIFEKIIYNQLYAFLSTCNIISDK